MTDDDFQSMSARQGRDFEAAVEFSLRSHGWTIVERRAHRHGVEIDIIALDEYGVEHWIECKGSYRGARPGSKRTDTVKKAIADAWYLSTCPMPRPYLLFTSHLPESGVAKRMLVRALEEKIVAGVVTPWGDELFVEVDE